MSAAWQAFADECARWRDAGLTVDFWWRDDDAAQPVPALTRLLELARKTQVPLALAVVPESADGELLSGLDTGVCVLQHGVEHRNRAAAGEKKTEFSSTEPVDAALERLKRGQSRLGLLAGARSLSVLVPPWNRLAGPLVAHLPGAGFRGLSRYGERNAHIAAAGLRQVNTHVDLVAWHSGRGFIGEEAALDKAVAHLTRRRARSCDESEPTGWLTHHACHDDATWVFLERLFEVSRKRAWVRWIGAREMFTP